MSEQADKRWEALIEIYRCSRCGRTTNLLAAGGFCAVCAGLSGPLREEAMTYPTQPEALPADGTVAALRAENERLKALLRECEPSVGFLVVTRENRGVGTEYHAGLLRRVREAAGE